MKRSYNILPIFLLLFFAAGTNAQDNSGGNVVIHSDPRLFMLRKGHTAAEAAAVTYTPPKNSEAAMNKREATAPRMAAVITKNKNEAKPLPVNLPVASSATTTSSKHIVVNAPAAPVKKITETAPAAVAKPGEKIMLDASASAPPVAAKLSVSATWPPVHPPAAPTYSAKGFRVQIYYGPDRKKAIEIKKSFMRLYPTVHSYLIYNAPSFRVKVGNYRNRGDAEVMLKAVRPEYSPVMIVPDNVSVSGL